MDWKRELGAASALENIPCTDYPLVRVDVLGSTIAVASLGAAHAESPSAADAAAEATLMNGAKISIAQAAAAADSQLGGKVVDIALEASIGTLLYPVTLLNPDGTEAEATIDATTARPLRV
jgi:uncharacterized membrane protein YkoI